MKPRLNYGEILKEPVQKLAEIGYTTGQGLDPVIENLIHNRASVMNGCTFCLDLDVKKAKLRGERELRLYHMAVWRESPLFNEREKAALEWAEAITKITPEGVSDELYAKMLRHFSEKEIALMTFQLGIINTWNRLNVAFRTPPGGLDALLGLDRAGLK